jgi:hypothetical protein
LPGGGWTPFFARQTTPDNFQKQDGGEPSEKRGFPMNNNLANNMSRLRGEIAALRDSRSTLVGNLTEAADVLRQEVAQLLVSFAHARAEMSRQTKGELENTILRVKGSVTELRQSVLELRRTFQDDIAGARQAWSEESADLGETPPPGKPGPKAKRKKR